LVRGTREGKVLGLAGNQRAESLHTRRYELREISPGDGQFQIPALDFSELEHLLKESGQPGCVDRQDFGQVRIPFSDCQALHRCIDDAQRGHQFVGDIGVELEFQVIEFLSLLFLHPAEPHKFTRLDAVIGVSPDSVGQSSKD